MPYQVGNAGSEVGVTVTLAGFRQITKRYLHSHCAPFCSVRQQSPTSTKGIRRPSRILMLRYPGNGHYGIAMRGPKK